MLTRDCWLMAERKLMINFADSVFPAPLSPLNIQEEWKGLELETKMEAQCLPDEDTLIFSHSPHTLVDFISYCINVRGEIP